MIYCEPLCSFDVATAAAGAGKMHESSCVCVCVCVCDSSALTVSRVILTSPALLILFKDKEEEGGKRRDLVLTSHSIIHRMVLSNNNCRGS